MANYGLEHNCEYCGIKFIRGDENRKKWDTYQPLDVVEEIIGDINGLFKSRN
jgi:tRNA A37 methylthiotransferase MiaB